MLTKFMVIKKTASIIMVMRPYQIYAVKETMARILGSNLNGYVFRTTGSGKTLTSYKLASLGLRHTDKALNEINRVTAQIKSVQKKLPTNDIMYGDDDFKIFIDNVCQTLNYRTGHTYVSRKKDKSIQKAFQAFFETLYDFLLFCKREDKSFPYSLKDLADNALYCRTIYRCLRHCSVDKDTESKVEPEYNNIYVSWSKKPNNSYIQSKLYGTITRMTCAISEPYYGIDLGAFGVGKGDEAEVVFPTVEEMITDIVYFGKANATKHESST